MGRQINFYMEETLQEQFIQKLFEKNFLIIAEDLENKKLVVYDEYQKFNSNTYTMYLYKNNFGELLTKEDCDYRLDYLKSPVIEFTKNLIKNDKMIITRGRLWLETKYYNDDGNIVCKDTIITQEYNALVRWIKNRIPFQEVTKEGYIVKEYVTDYMKGLADSGFWLM